MGTRADFYVGSGKDAEWLGSIAWDGYEWIDPLTDEQEEEDYKGPLGTSLVAATEKGFRADVAAIFEGRDDVTLPEQGWPWPWDTSATTDITYYFKDGKVFGEWFSKNPWPDMSQRKNVALGSSRSGVIVVGF